MTGISNSSEFMILCPNETTGTQHVDHANYHPLTADELEALIDYAVKSNHEGDVVEYSRAVIRITQAVPGMWCPTPFDDNAGVGDVVTAIESVMANWTPGSSPHFVIEHLLLTAGATL